MTQRTSASATERERSQLLLKALTHLKQGDFSYRLPDVLEGLDDQIAVTFNEIIAQAGELVTECDNTRRAIEEKGKVNKRLAKDGYRGGWVTYIDSVNDVLDCFCSHNDEIGRVIAAAKDGDLTQRIDLENSSAALTGEFLRQAKVTNTSIIA